MRVYRYFDAKGGLATLKSRQMRFASPLSFNDPFELTPRIIEPSDELLEERLRTDLWVNEFFERCGRGRALTEEESRKEYFANELPRRLEKLRASKAEKTEKLKWELVGQFAEHYRLLCCSHTHDSILMWSHYAFRHSGLVLEIETDEMIPGVNLAPCIFDVHYRTSPPTVPALYSNLELFEKSLNLVFTTKAIEWSYEEEVRIQVPAPNHLKKDEPHDQEFDPKCIKRVIVGCYNDPSAKTYETADELAEHSDYKHALFQRACLDLHDYKLRFADRPC